MRRLVAVLAAVAAAATCAPAAAATTSTSSAVHPQIRDAAGDWAVPSQDILDGTVTATAKTITVAVRLSSAPTPGLVTTYSVIFLVGCKSYVASVRWTGVAAADPASFDEYACETASSAPVDVTPPTATHPATFSVTGNTIRFSFATLPGLRPKTKVYAAANACTAGWVGLDGQPDKGVIGGDVAFSTRFVLGK